MISPRKHVFAAGLAALLAFALDARDTSAGDSKAPPMSQAEKQQRQDAAMKLHDEARDLYERGEYRAAITKLEAAHALDPGGKELIYNLALIHEKLGDLDEAESLYKTYLETESDPKIRDRVQNILKRIEGAKKDIKPNDTATVVAPPPPPPPPTLAQSRTSALAPAPPPASMVRPVGGAVVAASIVAGGAVVASGIFALTAAAKNPGASAMTSATTSIDDLQANAETAHRHAVLADVSLVVAVVATGAAFYFYYSTPPRRARSAAQAAVARYIAPTGLRVRF